MTGTRRTFGLLVECLVEHFGGCSVGSVQVLKCPFFEHDSSAVVRQLVTDADFEDLLNEIHVEIATIIVDDSCEFQEALKLLSQQSQEPRNQKSEDREAEEDPHKPDSVLVKKTIDKLHTFFRSTS